MRGLPFDATRIIPLRIAVNPPIGNTARGTVSPDRTAKSTPVDGTDGLSDQLATTTISDPLAVPVNGADTPSLEPLVKFEGLGSVLIDRIQLCEMGSSDEEGAYRSIAEMMLWS